MMSRVLLFSILSSIFSIESAQAHTIPCDQTLTSAREEMIIRRIRRDLTHRKEGRWVSQINLTDWTLPLGVRIHSKLPQVAGPWLEHPARFYFHLDPEAGGLSNVSVHPNSQDLYWNDRTPSLEDFTSLDSEFAEMTALTHLLHRLTSLALPEESFRVNSSTFRWAFGHGADSDGKTHRDLNPSQYIVITINLFAFLLTARTFLSGRGPLAVDGGTTWLDQHDNRWVCPTGWAWISSGVPRSKELDQYQRSPEHFATLLSERGTLVVTLIRNPPLLDDE